MDIVTSWLSGADSSSDDESPVRTERSPLLLSSVASLECVSINHNNRSPVVAMTENPSGLDSALAAQLLIQHGPNELPNGRRSPLVNLLRFLFLDPVSILVWIGIAVCIASKDWADFGVLLALQALNSLLTFVESLKADKALQALAAGLAQTALILRDGEWQELPAVTLVPGDLVRLTIGRAVPGDIVLVSGSVRVDTSSLTGESLPRAQNIGDIIFSGCMVVAGDAQGRVEATGLNTKLGASSRLMAKSAGERGVFWNVMQSLCRTLI